MIGRLGRLLCAPASAQPLALFRIAVAAFFLVGLWRSREAWAALYGATGWVGWSVTRHRYAPLPHLADVAEWLAPLGISADGLLRALIHVQGLALVLLLLGFRARAAALAAWICNVLLLHAGAGSLYGMDYFAHVALSYCVIMPVGDALGLPDFRRRRSSVAAGLTRRLLQLQLCIVYGVSGLEKARGAQWWNGDAIFRVLSLPSLRQVDVSWLGQAPWLATAAGWLVVAIECGYAPCMYWRRTRRWWLGAVIAMHVGIGLGLGLWAFALIMILLSAVAFGPEAWADLNTSASSQAAASAAR